MTVAKKVNFKKPDWLRKKLVPTAQKEMEALLGKHGLHTICQEAKCPNISECYAKKNATFLILGNICTRRCTYCNVHTGKPTEVDIAEVDGVTESVLKLGLKFVVITSPARDDLKDGGAQQFYRVTKNILEKSPGTQVEILIPDFQAKEDSLKTVVDSGAVIIGHNVETVPSLYRVRKNASYKRSLQVLKRLKELGGDKIKTKSALMVGLGETEEEMVQVFKDLLEVGCKFLSIGQYLAPSGDYETVKEFVKPEQFERYKQIALDLGFDFVHSTPYARSSYLAHEYLSNEKNTI
ncbi:lipoyl synthase [Malaciobacter marinus]|mgnify:CR=1 FL=1|jgi:lipoic acid synthetase|uniref:Lipoyl synthase n=1 Tax=Malaciobacter marinus TaxID=505249 RepID=A0A347TLK1_9BACT|nr:lipoyl synthase [Malaciobacter marinus]AXX87479.1 lipoic acid synthetase [Malaciobacter marinus]PHO13739.1 lipoyl synthase [Malaciobacter marinus]PHO14435.1 lipoyl synthase [Malaciobacter marinus]